MALATGSRFELNCVYKNLRFDSWVFFMSWVSWAIDNCLLPSNSPVFHHSWACCRKKAAERMTWNSCFVLSKGAYCGRIWRYFRLEKMCQTWKKNCRKRRDFQDLLFNNQAMKFKSKYREIIWILFPINHVHLVSIKLARKILFSS